MAGGCEVKVFVNCLRYKMKSAVRDGYLRILFKWCASVNGRGDAISRYVGSWNSYFFPSQWLPLFFVPSTLALTLWCLLLPGEFHDDEMSCHLNIINSRAVAHHLLLVSVQGNYEPVQHHEYECVENRDVFYGSYYCLFAYQADPYPLSSIIKPTQ